MSGFRKQRTVLSETAGSYVNGKWSAGPRSVITISASVQPLNAAQDMESLPEGRRYSESIKFYTDSILKTTEDGDGLQPDLIVHNGYCFEIVSRMPNENGVIQHQKYIATRAMKFTSEAAWLAGTLKRP